MVEFKCMAEWQMGMSAIKAMNKEKTLHKMWTSNEKIKSKISEMEKQYETYQKKLQGMFDEKNKIIAAHNQTIADLEKRNTNDINAEMYDGASLFFYFTYIVAEFKDRIPNFQI